MKHHLTKYRYFFVRALLAGALLAGLPLAKAAPPAVAIDRIIVKAKPGRDLAALHARGQGRVVKKIRDGELEFDVVKLPPGLAIADALAHYRGGDEVDYAEPDYIVSANATPNDPRFADGTLWSLNNTGQSGGRADADIDAPEAWNTRSAADNVVVAVLDTGVRHTHEDLAANMWRNPNEVAGNGRDDDGNGYVDDVHGINAIDDSGAPIDDNGHGTHVAGTIAAVGNNGRGSVGVAWRSKIMALKFLDVNGNGYMSDAVIAINYARGKGASVINASFAGPDYSVTLRDAILRARDAGIIIVAAAGNETANNDSVPSYPASFGLDNIVVVAATTRSDTLASYSNSGAQSVHLAAPGSSIYSTLHTSDDAYGLMSGTSMAAPHVAGAVALVRAQFSSDGHVAAIKRILDSVDALPALLGKCTTGGRLNLERSLQGTTPGPVNPVRLALLPGKTAGQMRVRLTGVSGQFCTLEQSTDLTRWTPIQTVSLPLNGIADITVNAAANPRVYYRARVM